MNNFQDYFSGVEYVRPSAPATINTDVATNFDFAIDSSDLGVEAILDVVTRAAGTAAITSMLLASDSGFSADVVTFTDSALTEAILKNDRLSSVAPFAQTSLSAAGKRSIGFGNVNKEVHKFCRIIVTTSASANLNLQVLVLKKKAGDPIVQA